MNFEYGDKIKHKLLNEKQGTIIADTWLGYRIRLDKAVVTGGMITETSTILYHLAEKL